MQQRLLRDRIDDNSSFHKDVIIIEGQYYTNEENYNKGISRENEYLQERQRLSFIIIDISGELDCEDLENKE